MAENELGILIQVQPTNAPDSAALRRLAPGTEVVSGSDVAQRLYRSFSPADIQAAIERICDAVTPALAKVKPESCKVEFKIGFTAEAKIPMLVSGEANAVFTISLEWKKAAEKARATNPRWNRLRVSGERS